MYMIQRDNPDLRPQRHWAYRVDGLWSGNFGHLYFTEEEAANIGKPAFGPSTSPKIASQTWTFVFRGDDLIAITHVYGGGSLSNLGHAYDVKNGHAQYRKMVNISMACGLCLPDYMKTQFCTESYEYTDATLRRPPQDGGNLYITAIRWKEYPTGKECFQAYAWNGSQSDRPTPTRWDKLPEGCDLHSPWKRVDVDLNEGREALLAEWDSDFERARKYIEKDPTWLCGPFGSPWVCGDPAGNFLEAAPNYPEMLPSEWPILGTRKNRL